MPLDMAGNLWLRVGNGTGRFLGGRTLIGTHRNVYSSFTQAQPVSPSA